MEVGAIAAIKVIVKEKHPPPLARSDDLLADVVEIVGLVSAAFGRQGAERATEIAITGSLDVANATEPVGQIVSRDHLLSYISRSECFSNHFLQLFNVSPAAVIEHSSCKQRQRPHRWTTCYHDDF